MNTLSKEQKPDVKTTIIMVAMDDHYKDIKDDVLSCLKPGNYNTAALMNICFFLAESAIWEINKKYTEPLEMFYDRKVYIKKFVSTSEMSEIISSIARFIVNTITGAYGLAYIENPVRGKLLYNGDVFLVIESKDLEKDIDDESGDDLCKQAPN